jgi:hypothetical protein
MTLSIHYYILSLSSTSSRLYEGFRDDLIDIQNTEFPLFSPGHNHSNPTVAPTEPELRDFFFETDKHFTHYYLQDPLRLMVVGQSSYLKIFTSLTKHKNVIMGAVEGDFTNTSPHDLGRIVWPIVKIAMAGGLENALRAIEDAEELKTIVSGIDAVWNSAESSPGATLYVEEDYHLDRRAFSLNYSQMFSKRGNLWDIFSDAVDIIIENILVTGGSVIFLNSGSMAKQQRIALILRS